MAVQNLRIKIRRDEFANWEKINPILYLAEQGYETDTRKMKIGDGLRRYLDLPYFGETLETIDGLLISSKLKLEVKTKFLINDLSIYDGREMETQDNLNVFVLENLDKQEEEIKQNEERINNIRSGVTGLEVLLEQLDDRVEIIEEGGLDPIYVSLEGDTMSGTLRIKDEDGYVLNLGERYEATIKNQSGLITITKDGDIKVENFYDNVEEEYVIDVKDPAIPNPLNALTISSTSVIIGRDTNILGKLFVGGVDILDVIENQIGGNIDTKIDRKYNKTGGPIVGPVEVFPGGVGTESLFEINSGGVWCYIEPTDPRHVATKGYVDRTKMPYDINKLKRLGNLQSFIG